MTGIEERVKGFVKNWRLTHCSICQGLLSDGNFAMIDGRLYCRLCHDQMKNDAEMRGRGGAENGKSE